VRWASAIRYSPSGDVDIVLADTFPDGEGNAIYRKSAAIVGEQDIPFHKLTIDNITFIRIIAKKR